MKLALASIFSKEVENTTKDIGKETTRSQQNDIDEVHDEKKQDVRDNVPKSRKELDKGIDVSELESLRWCFIA